MRVYLYKNVPFMRPERQQVYLASFLHGAMAIASHVTVRPPPSRCRWRVPGECFHRSVNACLAPVAAMHGLAVTTVEGIGSTRTRLHAVQKRIVESHGSQCGFCTPGIVMSMYTLLRNTGRPTLEDLDTALQGNLCRCTGYRPILEGFRVFTEDWERRQAAQYSNGSVNGSCGMGDKCCKLNGTEDHEDEQLFDKSQFVPYDPTQEPIFPPELKVTRSTQDNVYVVQAQGDKVDTRQCLCSTVDLPSRAQGDKVDTRQCLCSTVDLPSRAQGDKVDTRQCLCSTMSAKLDLEFLIIKGPRSTWYRPTHLDLLLDLKEKFPDLTSRIVGGNSEVGVEVKNRKTFFPVLIHPLEISELLSVSRSDSGVRVGAAVTLTNLTRVLKEEIHTQPGVEVKNRKTFFPVLIHPLEISELLSVSRSDSGVRVGAAVTLTNLTRVLKEEIHTQPEYKTRIFQSIVEILHWFAGEQIRNVSVSESTFVCVSERARPAAVCVGGRGGGDLCSLAQLITSQAVDTGHWWKSYDIESNIRLESDIFSSRKKSVDKLNYLFSLTGDVLFSGHGLRSIKMDHNFFTGYRRNVVKPDEVLIAINIPYTKQNQYFYAYKQSKRRDDDIAIVNLAVNVEFKAGSTTISDIAVACGGLAATTVLATSVKKSIGRQWDEETLESIYSALITDLPLSPSAPAFLAISEDLGLKLPAKYQSATTGFHTKPPKSSQYFRVAPPGQRADDPVGRTIVHKSSEKQATGEAVYCDDIPHYENELYLTLVLSSQAHALIKSIDASKALEVDGTVAFFSARDIPDKLNRYGMVNDEEIFASKEVTCQGQVIGAIVAKNQLIGQQAAKLVNVEYEVLDDVIVTLEDAIEKKSYFPGFPTKLTRGDIDQAFAESDHQICGEVRIGGQEHFYLETHTCIAVPKGEHDELELFCSTQNPTEIQKFVAESLGILSHKVVCRVKRMGGGFGGKESRSTSVALPVALAAHRLNRPVRCMLDRDEDMMITGTRHPFLGRYKVAFTKEGKLIGCDIQIYSNGGNTMDLSFPVLQRSMFHFSNAYFIPNVRVNGYICKTNIPSNTAFRGFGAPQGMFFGENMIRDVASFLRKDPLEIAELNLMKEGEKTHYNQVINRWKKRGLSVVPTMFGISFTALFLNQAGALVMVYEDGSVLLSHGGTEMGQGLHTKMIQVASRVLEIPHEYVHITETSTDKVPNTSATAASAGSDLNGMAVMNACQTIVDRLKPYKDANPKGEWKDWVHKAYFDRVSLSATGFYKTPDIGFDWDKNEGSPFNYYTFGTSCSVVEIDCLTGDHQVLRTDIVMDLGESLNPAIDVGQVEGGFVQGQGLFTLEETLFSPKGALFTRGPGWYKIPGFADIPIEFNVSLLKGVSNPRAIYSSKAVGEPPLFLAASIFFAIKDALVAARAESGKTDWFRLDAPATAERIRVAAADRITEKVQSTRSMRSKVQGPSCLNLTMLVLQAVGEPPLFLAASIFFAIKDALVAARAESGKTDWFRLDAPATAERIRVAAADRITEKVQSTRSMRSKVQVFKYRSENFNKIAVPI
uniref:xanthine dehydrogenase n=1 Tax=Timema cristinae TaxID=61476 RepID=A0A7R9CD49_TIMCR|nr:unnamed protein product [Timema cristinae]